MGDFEYLDNEMVCGPKEAALVVSRCQVQL